MAIPSSIFTIGFFVLAVLFAIMRVVGDEKHKNVYSKLFEICLMVGIAFYVNHLSTFLLAMAVIAARLTDERFILAVISTLRGGKAAELQAILLSPMDKGTRLRKYRQAEVEAYGSILDDGRNDVNGKKVTAGAEGNTFEELGNSLGRERPPLVTVYDQVFIKIEKITGQLIRRDCVLTVDEDDFLFDGFQKIQRKAITYEVKMFFGSIAPFDLVVETFVSRVEKLTRKGVNFEFTLVLVGSLEAILRKRISRRIAQIHSARVLFFGIDEFDVPGWN